MTALGSTDATTSISARVSIESLDNLVLTVRDVEATIAFYVGVLGMREEASGDGHRALRFGEHQTLELHVAGAAVTPGAAAATPGSAPAGTVATCFITRTPVEGVLRVLEDAGVQVEQGPVEREGASGQLLSVYVRDPDGNLVELANRLGE